MLKPLPGGGPQSVSAPKGPVSALPGYLLALAGLVATWWALSFALRLAALPSPPQALAALGRCWLQGLAWHTALSAYRVAVSMALATVTAVPLGLYLGRARAVDRLAGPAVYLAYPVPKSVFLPLVMAVMGLGDTARIFLVWLVVFFQVLVGVRDASRDISPQFLASIRSLGASWRDTYQHVVWPATLPAVFTSLRVALGTAIAVLFLAETWASDSGIGYFIMLAWSRLSWDEVFAGVLAMGGLGLAFYLLLDLLERLACPWRF